MRFTAHAKHNREPIERRFASAIEATREAWRLMAAGATVVYIFDDNTDKARWPDHFVELYRRVVMAWLRRKPSRRLLPRAPASARRLRCGVHYSRVRAACWEATPAERQPTGWRRPSAILSRWHPGQRLGLGTGNASHRR
jgi:hypothetical protein